MDYFLFEAKRGYCDYSRSAPLGWVMCGAR
jgi:hypothetical protein